ncbi:YihY/virulence factor BrkB family protein [Sphingomonas sp. MMS24-J13]|uniref:YihY/virulence factor BrkB family protein n=1 Tax=Sphingomonas sp. MMS24-J13 TaxID=3238686 RepID=UPI00384BF0DD
MQEISPVSPEERAKHPEQAHPLDQLRPPERAWEVIKRVVIGVYSDGFIHAGNLAYLALISLFPFFIVTAALAHMLGRSHDTTMAIESFLSELPPTLRDLLRRPIADVLAQRTGSLLWLGGLVGLWTTGSFIETIRDILRRAYGQRFTKPFWQYRLTSAALIIGAVMLTLAAFSAQLMFTGVAEFVYREVPWADRLVSWVGWSRLAPIVPLVVALYLLFYSLTPSKYRVGKSPKWPGALFTAVSWVAITALLPAVMALLGGYDRTYGSLAGVILALFFFWLVGLGLVIGAHLNAALAETPPSSVMGQSEAAVREE